MDLDLKTATENYRAARKELERQLDTHFPVGSLANVMGQIGVYGLVVRVLDNPDSIALRFSNGNMHDFPIELVMSVPCPGDTNGDGDCQKCWSLGGCPYKPVG